jgi:hypothetical protein
VPVAILSDWVLEMPNASSTGLISSMTALNPTDLVEVGQNDALYSA